MSLKPKIRFIADMRRLVARLRDDLDGSGEDFVLLYTYNCAGKIRHSIALKDASMRKNTTFLTI